jgi:chemotaxis protein histidine kinase CheA
MSEQMVDAAAANEEVVAAGEAAAANVHGDDDAAEAVRRAEAAVAALKDEYPQWAEKHLAGLEAAMGEARSQPEDRSTHLEAVADIAHDVKGEGATYGYPLMTELGESLYRFAAKIKDDSCACGTVHLDIVDKHIEAMRTVIRERIEGDGGDLGRELLATFGKAVEKFSG